MLKSQVLVLFALSVNSNFWTQPDGVHLQPKHQRGKGRKTDSKFNTSLNYKGRPSHSQGLWTEWRVQFPAHKGYKPIQSFYLYLPSFKILLDSRWSLLSEPTDIYNSFRSLNTSKSWKNQFCIISSNSSLKTEKPEVKKTSISDINAIHGMTAIRGYFLCNCWYWTTLSNINKPQFRRVRPNTQRLNSIFVD